MSPRKVAAAPSPAAVSALRTFYAMLGTRLNDGCHERTWSVQRLADEAGVSCGLAYLALRGEPVSLDAAMSMITALGLRLDWYLVDPRRKAPKPKQDIVHSAMGEFEAAHLRRLGFSVALDEPYQHYQFAGRADVVAWSLSARALLHIENRTRFPDLQEAAGSFNAKRAYLGQVLAQRLGIRAWQSEAHVMVALWSSEILHTLRLRSESCRVLCPADGSAFGAWWTGHPPPQSQRTAELVVLDPLARGRQRTYISLSEALTAKPRYSGYAETAVLLQH